MQTTESVGVGTRVWLLAAAMVIAGLAVFVVFRPALQEALSTDAAEPAAGAAPEARNPALDHQPVRPAPEVQGRVPPWSAASERRLPPRRDAAAPPPAAPASADDAEPSDTAEQPSGIALFPPPGTKPVLRGIIVPAGFELPPGYVRHYQATDDGRQLPPILMFHPDYHPVDARGAPVPLPENRVVPPEMAPAGLDVQMLDDPDTAVAQEGAPNRSREVVGPGSQNE